jgi:DNA replication protein DnaC
MIQLQAQIQRMNELIAQYPEGLQERALYMQQNGEEALKHFIGETFGAGYMEQYKPELARKVLSSADSIAYIAVHGANGVRFGAMFCGRPGCGKTMTTLHIARQIGRQILNQELIRSYEERILSPIRENLFRNQMILLTSDQQSDRETVQSFSHHVYRYVFLDDLIFAGLTDAKRQYLETIIETCCRNNSIIIGTTNIKEEDLKMIPEMQRVYSRLLMKCRFITFKNVDYRQQYQKKYQEASNDLF